MFKEEDQAGGPGADGVSAAAATRTPGKEIVPVGLPTSSLCSIVTKSQLAMVKKKLALLPMSAPPAAICRPQIAVSEPAALRAVREVADRNAAWVTELAKMTSIYDVSAVDLSMQRRLAELGDQSATMAADLSKIGSACAPPIIEPASWRPLLDSIERTKAFSAELTKIGSMDLLPSFDSISSVQAAVDSFAATLDRIHRSVTDLTRWALLPTGLFSGFTDHDQLMRALLLAAAEDARQNFIDSGNLEAVSDFAFRWLRLKPAPKFREATLEAVVQVLLEEEWCNLDIRRDQRTHTALRDRLKSEVKEAKRSWKWIGERKFNGAYVRYLNAPVSGDAESELIDLLSCVPSTDNVESLVVANWADPAVRGPVFQAVASLTPQEQEVAWLAASGHRWNEAAKIVGLPDRAGRNLRRKVQRITENLLNREHQRSRTVAERMVAL